MVVNTKPIATYTERLLEVRRDFALYGDRIVVQARWWPNRRFENVVSLATLKGEVRELTIRYRMFRYAGWVMAIGALQIFAMSYYNAKRRARWAVIGKYRAGRDDPREASSPSRYPESDGFPLRAIQLQVRPGRVGYRLCGE